MAENDKKIKDLGYANSWREKPDIVKKCAKLKHTRNAERIGRCLTVVTCEKCNYEYTVDSSG